MPLLLRSSLVAAALAAGALSCLAPQALAQNARLDVAVQGVRNDQGTIRCGLFAKAEGFREPGQELRAVDAKPGGGQARCGFDSLEPGTYALAVFHAERGEAQLEYGIFGQPKQGVGFSNNPSIRFGAPSFQDASFQLQSPATELNVQLKY